MEKVLLLGANHLGREIALELAKKDCDIIAVADEGTENLCVGIAQEHATFDIDDTKKLSDYIKQVAPDTILLTSETVASEALIEAESNGVNVVPSAKGIDIAINREKLKQFVKELGILTANYKVLEKEELNQIQDFPVIIKPIVSHSGKGNYVVRSSEELEDGYAYAMRYSAKGYSKVIVEDYIDLTTSFNGKKAHDPDYELVIPVVKDINGITTMAPISFGEEHGNFKESYQGFLIYNDKDIIPDFLPKWLVNLFVFNIDGEDDKIKMSLSMLKKANEVAEKVVTALAETATNNSKGYGVYGVELFIKGDDVYFSEVSPYPHEAGYVTLLSQSKSQFELHIESILGKDIDLDVVKFKDMNVIAATPTASRAVIARGWGKLTIDGIDKALKSVEGDACNAEGKESAIVRLFGVNEVKEKAFVGVTITSDKVAESAIENAREMLHNLDIKVINEQGR